MWTMGPKISAARFCFLATSREVKIPDMGRLKGDLWVPGRRSKKHSCGVAWWLHKKQEIARSRYYVQYVHKEEGTG